MRAVLFVLCAASVRAQTCALVPGRAPDAETCNTNGYARNFAGTLHTTMFSTSSRIGNVLSPYWMSLAMARIGGLAFESQHAPTGPLKYLPSHFPARDTYCPAEFSFDCEFCRTEYAHKCFAWQYIRGEIADLTRAALRMYALVDGAIPIPTFGPLDVVIYIRCSKDTVLDHPEYGPVAFSFYDTIPHSTRRITVVSHAESISASPFCTAHNRTLFEHMAHRRPRARLEYSSGGIWEDWAKLVYAPTLYRDPGSYSLWAALANTGTVHSAPLYANHPDLVPGGIVFDGWSWTNAPVLYPHTVQGMRLENALEWLESH